MRLLLDSHVALWWLADSPDLGPVARAEITSASEVFFSPASLWELGIKKALGRLQMPDGFADELLQSGFRELAITSIHAASAAALPPHHRDPFDRMLNAQANAEALTLVTADEGLSAYEVATLDART